MRRVFVFITLSLCLILLVSCGNKKGNQGDLENLKEQVRKLKEKDSLSDEQREKLKKSLFPKLKEKN